MKNWEKRRPDYAKYLSKASALIDALPASVVEELFSATKQKTIHELLGLDSTFTKTVVGIKPSTVSDWFANGKNGLYIGLVAGAILCHLEELLTQEGKSIDDVLNSDMCVTDLIFIWRHRPTVLSRLISTL